MMFWSCFTSALNSFDIDSDARTKAVPFFILEGSNMNVLDKLLIVEWIFLFLIKYANYDRLPFCGPINIMTIV